MKRKFYLLLLVVFGIWLLLPNGVKAETVGDAPSIDYSANSMLKLNLWGNHITPTTPDEYFGYFYLNDVNSEQVPNDLKIILGWNRLRPHTGIQSQYTIPKDDMSSAIKNIFGSNTTYTDKSVPAALNCWLINYDSTQEVYNMVQGGCGGLRSPYYETKIIKSEKIDSNTLVVYQKAIYAKWETEENASTTNFKVYKADKNTLLSTFILKNDDSAIENDLLSQFSDCVDTYKFTFKFANENDGYYFSKVENMKDAKICQAKVIDKTKTSTTKSNSVKNPNTGESNIILMVVSIVLLSGIVILTSNKIIKKEI